MPHRLTVILGAAGLCLAGTAALADDVAPQAVKYEDGAVAASLTGAPGDAAKGAKIVGDKKMGNCVACHQVAALADIPWQGEIGPALDGAGSRWDEAQLRGIVADAKKTFDGTMMPSFYKDTGYIRPGDGFTGKAATELKPILDAQQIEDVVAFLASLKE